MDSFCRVFLVGMMGSGKTTVGKRLAKALNVEFVDVDQKIEASTGVSVTTIFELEGETGFREREASALKSLAGDATSGRVIATGGGAVLSPTNRARMTATGYVAYLHAPAELLYARTRHDRGRPLLQVEDPLAKIRMLVAWRDPLYREIADIVVESGTGIQVIVNNIANGVTSSCRP